MARFEMKVVIAKRKDDTEVITEEKNYVCFCENVEDQYEINRRARGVVRDEIEYAEGEVLFGSADVFVEDEVLFVFGFRNTDADHDDIEDLLDLILDHETETIH